MKLSPEAGQIMLERFGHDSLLAVATSINNMPYVRTVDAYYEDGAFYVVTYALSKKMKQIQENPTVAVCGDWFTAHGTGENLGWVCDDRNAVIMSKLRTVFAAWYGNGHVNEDDPNTCLLKIKLSDGLLFGNGTWYNIDFTSDEE